MRVPYALSLCAAAFVLATPAAAQDTKVALGISGWTGFAPLTLAKEAGIFKKHGLEIETLYTQGGGETQQAVIANRNVHFEKGTLLQYCNVGLTESESNREAYRDANERDQLRSAPMDPKTRDRIIGQPGSAVSG